MSATARSAILARLRAAQRAAWLPRVDAPAARAPDSRSTADCLQRFREEAEALGVDCWVDGSAAAVAARVAAYVEGKRVFSWDPDALPYGVGALVADAVLGRSARDEQAAADVGLTGCDAAIAETATLAMISAPGRSRAVSLLPPLHVAVVTPGQLCYSMGEFFAAHRDALQRAASCTFITGPSRTADIELTLTLGIHGPGRVVVIFGPE